MKRIVWLDTDIGTDVDDLYTLIQLCRTPEVDLVGVSTVHGDTRLRAQIAGYATRLLGREDLPIAIGAERSMSGEQPSWGGFEGEGIEGLSEVKLEPGELAVAALSRAAASHARGLEILAIGPLTNVAEAVKADPNFAGQIRRLYLMGGSYKEPFREHNVATDRQAAEIVFGSKLQITALGLDVTLRVEIAERELDAVKQIPDGIGALLEHQTRVWWDVLRHPHCRLHDPLTGLAITRPDLFEFARGTVTIRPDGTTAF
ncbi:MAG: nucleoside hydrolase, partial [Verrucomicrobia bacterium]|nr:nucleoside hydrolase [Verrucomicrobiota bacterium]